MEERKFNDWKWRSVVDFKKMKEDEQKESVKGQRERQKEYVAVNKKLKSLKAVAWILFARSESGVGPQEHLNGGRNIDA